METRPPTTVQLLVAIGFALSCFGLLLFLWLAFGGPTPLKPEGYRITVPFEEASQLATESDVRISGVSVGKVKQVTSSESGLAEATIEMDESYAPLPTNTRAVLREKTLLGETYVELTPGNPDGPTIPEGGGLPQAQVSKSVQLDEVFRSFDQPTRTAFQRWMKDSSVALRRRGVDLNAALGNLDPFSAETDNVLRILDTQRRAVRRLVRNGGEVFTALSERRGQLQGLIRNADTVFSTTARRNRDLQDAFVALPTFLDESRFTLDRLKRFADDTDPLVKQLDPAFQELSPTLIEIGRLAPQLRGFFTGLRGTVAASKHGLPALQDLLDDDLPPLLGAFDPWLRTVNPILAVLKDYKHEITAFFGNAAAALNAFEVPPEAPDLEAHYLRTIAPLNPETVSSYPDRLRIDRTNPYLKPQTYTSVKTGLPGFETRQCTSGLTAKLESSTATNPAFSGRFPTPAYAQEAFGRLKKFAFTDQLSTANVPAPPCAKQDQYRSIGGTFPEFSDYLHVRGEP